MAAGIQPSSPLIHPAFSFLLNIDEKRLTTFFWRSGPLLNVEGYEAIVQKDIDHLSKLRERAGGNPNYPAPFFLLKLLRFGTKHEDIATEKELVNWLIGEWDEEKCWYGLTSITSMGLALLIDYEFVPKRIIERSIEFLISSYAKRPTGRYGFSDNIVDDAFTVYNLYERYDVIHNLIEKLIFDKLDECIDQILDQENEGLWESAPPFGGSVDNADYATAVVVRAAIARQLAYDESFEIDLALGIADQKLQSYASSSLNRLGIEPFWGEVVLRQDPFCFVAMPFEDRRTEIYEEYIKRPIESKLDLQCRRVDEITKSREIMRDMWDMIMSCSIVIADLSDQNPNVFYELGLAHVLGKPVVLIVEDINDLPFDLRSVRNIIYGNSPKKWEELSQKVVQFVSTELKLTPT